MPWQAFSNQTPTLATKAFPLKQKAREGTKLGNSVFSQCPDESSLEVNIDLGLNIIYPVTTCTYLRK